MTEFAKEIVRAVDRLCNRYKYSAWQTSSFETHYMKKKDGINVKIDFILIK